MNFTCMPNTGPNPISKYISYDNFGWSLLTSLQLVTMDYWESIYNSVSISPGSFKKNWVFLVLSPDEDDKP